MELWQPWLIPFKPAQTITIPGTEMMHQPDQEQKFCSPYKDDITLPKVLITNEPWLIYDGSGGGVSDLFSKFVFLLLYELIYIEGLAQDCSNSRVIAVLCLALSMLF